MKKITALLLLILLVQTSCDKIGKECGECFTPPPTFIFQFIDKDNGENLFSNNTFDINNVSVTDEKNEKVEFEYLTENGINVLNLKLIGWNLDPKSYTIKLNDTTSVNFDLNMNEMHSECCSFFEIEHFEVYYYEYEREYNDGFIIVKM